jgi:hypothetical protein
MAIDGGNGSLPTGTGANKQINVGVSLAGVTCVKVHLRNSSYKDFDGYSFSGGAYQYGQTAGINMDVGKFFKVRNNSGTTVIEGTFTGVSGTNLVFNLTANVASPPDMLFEWQ